MKQLTGVCTPICTVFSPDGRSVDMAAQSAHLENLLEAGVHIIAVCGGTGEFSFLSKEERLKLTETVAKQIDGRAKLIVHVSAVMTEQTIEFAKHAQGAGADCLLVLPPYFEGPTLAGVYEHYERVAKAVEVDVMAYNIPVHSGIDLSVDFCCELMDIDNIKYLKDSTGDFIRIQQLVAAGVPVFNGGASEQVMNDQFESKIADLIVAKLRNSPAIAMAMARVSRLDLAHFDSQPDSPRLIQDCLPGANE